MTSHDIPNADFELWNQVYKFMQDWGALITYDLGQFSGIESYHYSYGDFSFMFILENGVLIGVNDGR